MSKTKIDIFSGFLGAGKTTLIKKLIREAYSGEKVVLIENEFGDIAIDGGFLKDAGIQITEMSSGCICCSLVGDFRRALQKVLEDYAPERIIIEPSGVGKLSDVIRAVQDVDNERAELNGFTTVVDAKKCKMYMKNFGEFFNDQVENSGCIVLSHTGGMDDGKLAETVALLREHNATATIVTTDWEMLSGKQLLEAMERKSTLEAELARLAHEHEEECDDPECSCHHHHHHDDDDDDDDHECHHHHHHDDDDDDDDHECHHHHHHDDDDDDDDHECHHHHHHHHHHADEVFTSWGVETTNKYTPDEMREILTALNDSETYGVILRAKGIVEGVGGTWIHYDYVPGEPDVREGSAGIIGRLCVIGSGLKEDALKNLFRV